MGKIFLKYSFEDRKLKNLVFYDRNKFDTSIFLFKICTGRFFFQNLVEIS